MEHFVDPRKAPSLPCRSASVVLRAVLAKGSGQKFIARGYQTTEADPCTTGSKKARTESVQG